MHAYTTRTWCCWGSGHTTSKNDTDVTVKFCRPNMTWMLTCSYSRPWQKPRLIKFREHMYLFGQRMANRNIQPWPQEWGRQKWSGMPKQRWLFETIRSNEATYTVTHSSYTGSSVRVAIGDSDVNSSTRWGQHMRLIRQICKSMKSILLLRCDWLVTSTCKLCNLTLISMS